MLKLVCVALWTMSLSPCFLEQEVTKPSQKTMQLFNQSSEPKDYGIWKYGEEKHFRLISPEDVDSLGYEDQHVLSILTDWDQSSES